MTLNIDPVPLPQFKRLATNNVSSDTADGATSSYRDHQKRARATLRQRSHYVVDRERIDARCGERNQRKRFDVADQGTVNIRAQNAVAINSTVGISGAGAVNLSAATDPNYGIAQLSFGNGGSVQFTGTPDSGQALSINGQSYTLLYSMNDLQNIIDGNLSGNYALAKPLDATGVANWTPIGRTKASATRSTMEWVHRHFSRTWKYHF